MPRYEFVQNDTWPPIEAYIEDEKGPVPLMGARVEFLMREVDGDKFVQGIGEAINPNVIATNPNVRYTWRSDKSDTNVAGVYRAVFKVVFAPGTLDEREETFPSGEYIDVILKEDLG